LATSDTVRERLGQLGLGGWLVIAGAPSWFYLLRLGTSRKRRERPGAARNRTLLFQKNQWA